MVNECPIAPLLAFLGYECRTTRNDFGTAANFGMNQLLFPT